MVYLPAFSTVRWLAWVGGSPADKMTAVLPARRAARTTIPYLLASDLAAEARPGMKVLFLHGWQSVPGGVKPTFLARHGHEVVNPKLPDEDFEGAVRIAQAEFDRHQPAAVVGSSRGGAVALNIDSGRAKLVLLCAAAFAGAVKAGAVPVAQPRQKPWGQVVAYVRDSNGFLVEICSPM